MPEAYTGVTYAQPVPGSQHGDRASANTVVSPRNNAMKLFKDLMRQNREIAKHIKSYAKPKDPPVNNAGASAGVEKVKAEQ